MLYVYRGTDTKKNREKLNAVVDKLREKQPDAVVERPTLDAWHEERFAEFLSARSLFVTRQIVVLDHLVTDKEVWPVFEDCIEELRASESLFFVLETDVRKAEERAFETYAEKVVVTDVRESGKASGFNVFALTDAIGARDRRMAWVFFHEAQESGLDIERDIFWKIVWQIKNMLLVSGEGATAESVNMKPFVFGKATSSARHFDVPTLRAHHKNLVALYHDTRRGTRDFSVGLESFLLHL